jgi:putative transposase
LRWSTFLRLHAQGIIACDFFVAVTATFRLLYVFVVIEHRSRRLIHCNVTTHTSAAWTLQQLRVAVGFEGRYDFTIAIVFCQTPRRVDRKARSHRAEITATQS